MKIDFRKTSIHEVINAKKLGINNTEGRYLIAYLIEISPERYQTILRILNNKK